MLAIVIVDGDAPEGPYYIGSPFKNEPDFGVASINYDLADLLSRAASPGPTA
jgi:exosome complex RNA-binding protein Rrp42 (RNase PH superfamily)